MNDRRKSDRFTVPAKSPNKAEQSAAEGMEGRDLAEGNLPEHNAPRTQSRSGAPSALERVRQAARKDRKTQFTTLLHHIYNPDTLRAAYFALKREAAPGVDGETWRDDLEERFRQCNLELHPEKTRLLEFGPFAAENRRRRGEGKPETFDFLGFTHICAKKRSNGRFTMLRQTIRKRLQAKLNEVKADLPRRLHDPVPEQGKCLRSVVGGHCRYYGVPMNGPALFLFRFRIGWLWHCALSRRGQNGRIHWDRMRRLIDRRLPPARVCHPYPLRRLGVIT